MRDRFADLQAVASRLTPIDDHSPSSPKTSTSHLDNFFDQMSELRSETEEIDRQVTLIVSKFSQIATEISPYRRKALALELKELDDNVSSRVKAVRASIQKMDASDVKVMTDLSRKSAKYDSVVAEVRIRQSHRAGLNTKLARVVARYRQAHAGMKLKDFDSLLHRARIVVDPSIDAEDVARMLESGEVGGVAEEGRYPQLEMMLAEVSSRHQELRSIEKSLQILYELFVDMTQLICTQGEVLDRIDDHVEHADESIAKASADLHQAKKLKKSLRSKKWAVGILLVVTVGIVAVVLPSTLSVFHVLA